jgi:hypothetical protein
MVDPDQIERLMYNYFEDDQEERITTDNYVIDTQGAVHVNSSIMMFKGTGNRLLPVQFAVVDGDCIFADRQLKSLKGAPHTVNGDFDCSGNALTSLTHAPKQVARMGAQFRCDRNQLTSLAHAPTNAGEVSCNDNLLKNLQDAPPCGYLWAPDNPFESFKHTPDHIHEIMISYKPELPLLGLLVVGKIHFQEQLEYHGVTSQQVEQLEEILNRHTQQGKAGQLKCAGELIRAGFKQHAYI